MNDERDAVSIERGDRAAAAREIARFITRNPNIFGGADIFNLDFADPIVRAGMLAAVLTGIVDTQRRPVVRCFVIVVPPGNDAAAAFEMASAQFAETFQLLAQREITVREGDALRSRLRVCVAADRRHRSLLEIIARQDDRAAVIITEAAAYRDDKVQPYIAPGASTPLQPEDVWAPQLHALATAAAALAGERTLYVALDADELSPRRQALADLLLSADGCGVMGSASDDDSETILAAHVDEWDAWVREGRLGRALRGVDALPNSLIGQKGFLRIQLLYRAGHLEQALAAIRERLHEGGALNAQTRVKLARVAQDANAIALTAELLAPAVDMLNGREDLESALATARNAKLVDLEDKIAGRLEGLFPGGESIERRRLVGLVRGRDYAGAAAVAREALGDETSARYFEALARHLLGTQVPDYPALIAEAGRDTALADAYRMACVRDALSRKLLVHAFDLILPLPASAPQARRCERLLLETLEALLLVSDQNAGWPVPRERFQGAILALVERLASDPENRVLRVSLVELMQPEIAGTKGLALMALLVLQLASRPIELRVGGAPGTAAMDWLMTRKPFLRAAFDWMKAEAPVMIGRSVLPTHLLSEPADEVVSAIASYLNYAPAGAPDDDQANLTWLALAAAVAPHASDPDYDLRLIRLVAGKLASAGNVQQARDLAEQALLNGAGSARRRRLGWFAMADVYARAGNHIEALLAMACTLAADDGADEEEAFQEIVGVARLLRDCGLDEQARHVIARARHILHRLELQERYGHQLDTFELQLRQMRLQKSEAAPNDIAGLIADVVANGREVLNHQGLTAPAAALLGQLLRIAGARGISVPPDADVILKELIAQAKGSFATLVAAIAAPSPTADQLLAMVHTLGAARYSDDVGFDMRKVAIAAGRALSNEDLLDSPEAIAFVLDLLADRGVALPGWDEAAAPAPTPKTIKETADIARAVSRAGISVVQAGFDERGRLVRLATVDGELGRPVREPYDVILEERVKHWAVEFPYRYGIDESTVNLFYTTTADLRLSSLPSGPLVFVADATLQAFPPNLLFVAGEFAGRTTPMAAAPSLAWLGRAREIGLIGDGRMCAWMSTAGGSESQTLPMIAERLAPTFEEYDFVVDHGPVLPPAVAGATLAVITAHGGVHPEGRFFHVVSDEGVLRVTAADLANALRNIGVVVLFVCSGGRADKHPAANTTLGLAKQIVDRGCPAVVASPWPLDARVPSHWLPSFLERWIGGATLIEANFQANQVVDRVFGGDPARGLAMTVYGNPELRYSKAPSGSDV